MCHEMTLCVLACFIMFYVFVFDEIQVRGDKIAYNNVLVRNVRENILKDQPRVLEKGPKLRDKTVLGNPKRRRHQRLVGLSTPRLWVPFVGT